MNHLTGVFYLLVQQVVQTFKPREPWTKVSIRFNYKLPKDGSGPKPTLCRIYIWSSFCLIESYYWILESDQFSTRVLLVMMDVWVKRQLGWGCRPYIRGRPFPVQVYKWSCHVFSLTSFVLKLPYYRYLDSRNSRVSSLIWILFNTKGF